MRQDPQAARAYAIAALDVLFCPVWICDAQGKILYANTAARHISSAISSYHDLGILDSFFVFPPSADSVGMLCIQRDGGACRWLAQVRQGAWCGETAWFITGQTEMPAGVPDQDASTAEVQDVRSLDVAQVGSWDWDLVRRELRLSPHFAALLKRDASPILVPDPVDWSVIMPEDEIEFLRAQVRACVEGAVPELDVEHRLLTGDGGYRWFLSRAQIVRDASGAPIALAGTSTDITDRKRIEEDRALLNSVIEQAADSVAIMDAEGSVLYVNPAFERTTGYAWTDVIDQNIRYLKSGPLDSAKRQAMWDTVQRGEVWASRFASKRFDDTVFQEEATVSPVFNSAGKLVNFVMVSRDVTREYQLEMDLRQAQKLQAIGQLAGGIAHDFNNLLQVIMGYADRALEAEPSEGRTASALRQILTAGARGADLVSQILTFSRQTESERRPLRLQPVIKEVVKFLRGSLPSTIEIRQSVDAGCRPVQADLTQIHQVVMNLCTNAFHAMRERGGILEINLSEQELGEAFMPVQLSPGAYACIRVVDTGCGMDATTLEHIFEPYFTTRKPGEGTGLGLATAHGIVSSHQGAIVAQSAPGKGARFDVYLPVIDAEEGVVRTVVLPPASAEGTERVLFVDDEGLITELAISGLASFGYQIEGFSDSIAALEAVKADPDRFDVVVTDQTMPGLTGLQLATEIRQLRPDIPILLCTGYSESVQDRTAREAGVREYVQKPLTIPQLARAIRRVLSPEI